MDRSKLTVKQRQALQCVQDARAARMSLSGYARSRQLAVRPIYDALVSLRKKGLMRSLAPSAAKSPFVAVRVVPRSAVGSASPSGARVVCRMVYGAGLVVECAEWPPTAWLAELSAGRADAAP